MVTLPFIILFELFSLELCPSQKPYLLYNLKINLTLLFTSASGCRASENLADFQCKLTFFSIHVINFCDSGQMLFQIFQSLQDLVMQSAMGQL